MCLQKFPPPSSQIFQNLPLDRYIHVLAEIPPRGADVLKSATGQLPKLPTCACRNSSPFADFPKSATGHTAYMCLQKFPPSLQIFQNLPLDRYLHVLAQMSSQIADFTKSSTGQIPICDLQKFPPMFADFPKSATGQIHTCSCRNSPLRCRCSKICHWTVT